MRNAGIAQEEGAQGVWLVNHGGPGDDMLAMASALLDANDGLWTGVNLQDSDVNDALRRLGKIARSGGRIDGYWCDEAEIDTREQVQYRALATTRVREESGWHGIYFAGTAFKYRRAVHARSCVDGSGSDAPRGRGDHVRGRCRGSGERREDHSVPDGVQSASTRSRKRCNGREHGDLRGTGRRGAGGHRNQPRGGFPRD